MAKKVNLEKKQKKKNRSRWKFSIAVYCSVIKNAKRIEFKKKTIIIR